MHAQIKLGVMEKGDALLIKKKAVVALRVVAVSLREPTHKSPCPT
jgi:hypothetical protein